MKILCWDRDGFAVWAKRLEEGTCCLRPNWGWTCPSQKNRTIPRKSRRGHRLPAAEKPRGRKPLPRPLKRERIEHDLLESEKHCGHCDQDLRRIGEEVSERYEYIPAEMKVIEDACFTYACAVQPHKVWSDSSTPCRVDMFACRCSGR